MPALPTVAASAAILPCRGIDSVQLEDPLGDVQTDCGNLHGGRLLLLVALNGPSLAQRCRQGSSTASDFSNSALPGTSTYRRRRERMSHTVPAREEAVR